MRANSDSRHEIMRSASEMINQNTPSKNQSVNSQHKGLKTPVLVPVTLGAIKLHW